MNEEILKWTNRSQDEIIELVAAGKFNALLKQCIDIGGLSISEIASDLKCSRRAIRRYLAQERTFPFELLIQLLKSIKFDLDKLFAKMQDSCSVYYRDNLPVIDNDIILWRGGSDILVNMLHILRTQILKISHIEMGFRTTIPPERLCEYEDGRCTVYQNDIVKICSNLHIGLTELFPQLCSYDGNNTFLPLRTTLILNDTDWFDFYISDNNDCLNLMPVWPVNRYNRHGKKITNVMPNELTVDEYYNTDELYFLNDEFDFYNGPDADLETLPPNYYRYELLVCRRQKFSSYKNVYKVYSQAASIDFSEPYNVIINWRMGPRPTVIDMSPYINSCSPWYRMLRNTEYFKKGKIVYIDKDRPETQCIIWPHGQYIRLDETKMNQHPYINQFPEIGHIEYISGYENWINWKTPK